MTTNNHPYASLPPSRFWKTAVADVDPMAIDLEWKPRFPITRETGIITLGSCFAQHISKSLRLNGYKWLDSEPAPPELPPDEHAKHGYGVFSFRTGNIYTAALLRQWIVWATGKAEPGSESFLDDGRHYDPYRPSLGSDGFRTAGEMLAARREALAAMLETIRRADLFIFTLGLTEAWLNKDGSVYPMCPGTIRGTFSSEEHVFHNYSGQEVVRDLAATFDELRGINPNLRFLLTVSPVPLTATASDEHVLTATTYSKSVLRSAAGYLARSREDVDYFPSYELVTAPAFRGRFFEKNLRSVTSEGVAFVMGQFFRAIRGVATPGAGGGAGGMRSVAARESGEATSGKDICDEIILETWSGKTVDDSAEPPNIVLVGDSHLGLIAKALEERQIRYAGGAIMNRSDWHALRFDLDDEWLFTPKDPEQRARWESTWRDSFARGLPTSGKPWVITNVGMQTSLAISDHGLFGYLAEGNNGQVPGQISGRDLQTYLLASRRPHLGLLCRFLARGYSVLVVTNPPTEPYYHELFAAADAMFIDLYKSIGCSVFSAREWINSMGGFPPAFWSLEIEPATNQPEWEHGSSDYYRQLVKEILSRYPIVPRFRAAQPAATSPAPERLGGLAGADDKRAGAEMPATAMLGKPDESGTSASADEICDEIILETWSRKASDSSGAAPRILLIGDSQMGMIARVLDERGIRYAGGGIMNGSEWHSSQFTPIDEFPFLAPFDPGARGRLEEACSAVSAGRAGGDSPRVTIITNVGFHSSAIFTPEGIARYYNNVYGKNVGLADTITLSGDDITNYLHHCREPHFAVLRKLVKSGHRVIWVSDPPVNPISEPFANLTELILRKMLGAIGCEAFSSREWIARIGGMRDAFISDEVHPDTGRKLLAHGSDEYYRQLVTELLDCFAIQAEPGQAG